MRPGAIFAFITFPRPTINIWPIASKLPNIHLLSENLYASSKDELEALAMNAGFQNVEIIEKEVCMPFPSLDHYLRWFASSTHVMDYQRLVTDLRRLCETEGWECLQDKNGEIVHKQNYSFGHCQR